MDKYTLMAQGQAVFNPSTKTLMAGLYESNNFDGKKASEAWEELNAIQTRSQIINFSKYCFLGMFGLSLYHSTRLGSLSRSGRLAALGGLAYSVQGLYAT